MTRADLPAEHHALADRPDARPGADARTGVPALTPVRATRGWAIAEAFDVSYGPHPRHAMDIRWQSSNVPAPLVVILPGERTSSTDDPAGLLASALTEEGFATAVVGVRAYGDPSHPAQVRDVQSAILHLKARAVDDPIDASRIGVLGISLGGWLAGLMATRPPLQPKAVVTWSGLLDPLTYPDHRVGTRLLGCEYRDCPTAWEHASPQVLADPYASPWLVAQSPDEKVPLDQGALLDAKLAASDVDHQFVVLPHGSGHGMEYVDRIFPDTVAWFRSHL